MLLILTALLPVEILSGGESEGGSLEEHVGQETQVPQSIANPHGDDKSVVRRHCQNVKRQLVWDLRVKQQTGFKLFCSKMP